MHSQAQSVCVWPYTQRETGFNGYVSIAKFCNFWKAFKYFQLWFTVRYCSLSTVKYTHGAFYLSKQRSRLKYHSWCFVENEYSESIKGRYCFLHCLSHSWNIYCLKNMRSHKAKTVCFVWTHQQMYTFGRSQSKTSLRRNLPKVPSLRRNLLTWTRTFI